MVTKNAPAGGTGRGRWTFSTITNPKVLVFYPAVLPQCRTAGTGAGRLLALSVGLDRLRGLLLRRTVHRGMDAATGAALLGFSARLATEHG